MPDSRYADRGVLVNMRRSLILAVALCAVSAAAQPGIWSNVSTTYSRPQTPAAALSEAQQKAVALLLRGPHAFGEWNCAPGEIDAVLKNSAFEWIALIGEQGAQETGNVLLVESPSGCARGGQGANGAMWLIRLDGPRPALIASPTQAFNGWLYSIQPASSHGLRDIVLGWHMGAGEADLTYFRFDGVAYQPIGHAALLFDEGDSGKIVPAAN